MPKKKPEPVEREEEEVPEMREMEMSEVDGMSYDDSGHASEALSRQTDDDDQVSDRSSTVTPFGDPKEMMKKMAKERIRKCLVFMKEFWKIILFLLQTGVIGGIGLLAYYMEFQDVLPRKHTVFDCDDKSIAQHMDTTVFEYFIFGDNIDEQWIFLFSWMAPPGIMIMVEFFYSLHTGCALSHHMKTPLILRRTFRFIGNYFFGVMGCLVISKSIKLFTATPRPYFLYVCQPNISLCVEATEAICTNTNTTELNDARTSFPSMPVGALSFACFFTGMIRRSKAFVLQPLASTIFLIISLLGACIELGVKRSHWYDVLAGFTLGLYMAVYQVSTLNYFVEKFQPPLPLRRDDMWVQTDPMPEPEIDDEYPYEDIMMGKLPKRRERGEDNSCFHRATSFDNTFQMDMARSMTMFKVMNSMWTGKQPPTLSFDHGVYELPDSMDQGAGTKAISARKLPKKSLLDIPGGSRRCSVTSLSSAASSEGGRTALTVEDELNRPSIKKIYTPKGSPKSVVTGDSKDDSILHVTVIPEEEGP